MHTGIPQGVSQQATGHDIHVKGILAPKWSGQQEEDERRHASWLHHRGSCLSWLCRFRAGLVVCLYSVYKDGKVCISILHEAKADEFNTQEKMSEKCECTMQTEARARDFVNSR